MPKDKTKIILNSNYKEKKQVDKNIPKFHDENKYNKPNINNKKN